MLSSSSNALGIGDRAIHSCTPLSVPSRFAFIGLRRSWRQKVMLPLCATVRQNTGVTMNGFSGVHEWTFLP